MSIKIRVYSDFVCPFCYLAETPLKKAIENQDVEVEWMPFELRPYPQETLKPNEEYLQRTWKESVLPYAEKLGIPIKLPEVSPQPHTDLAQEGLLFAKEHGKGSEYASSVFQAFFEEGLNIGDIEVLTIISGQIGLDPSAFKQSLQNRTYKSKRVQYLKEAHQQGITAVPTMYIGDRILKGLYPESAIARALRGAIRDEKMEFCEGDNCE